jgi:hypothetical protein
METPCTDITVINTVLWLNQILTFPNYPRVLYLHKWTIRQSALTIEILQQDSAGSKFIVFRKRELHRTLDNIT